MYIVTVTYTDDHDPKLDRRGAFDVLAEDENGARYEALSIAEAAFNPPRRFGMTAGTFRVERIEKEEEVR